MPTYYINAPPQDETYDIQSLLRTHTHTHIIYIYIYIQSELSNFLKISTIWLFRLGEEVLMIQENILS